MNHSELCNLKMDPIPFCIFKEQILGEPIVDPSVRDNRAKSTLVTKITGQQLEDGSWDKFHTLSSNSATDITTENAIRRLLVLGFKKGDAPLRKAFHYMEQYLNRDIDYRDTKESLSDWRDINELFTAAWMLEIDSSSNIAGRIADKWATLIKESFKTPTFNHSDYMAAFRKIFGVAAGKRVWNLECFHVVAIARGRLSPTVEDRFIQHVLSNARGLYYITNAGKLDSLPSEFMSRNSVRFIWAHYLLSKFPSYRNYKQTVCDWLLKNRHEDGLWDFGAKSKDDMFLPYSDSWRIRDNRKIDSTLLVKRYLHSLGEC